MFPTSLSSSHSNWALTLNNILWIEKIFAVLTYINFLIFTKIVEFCKVFEIFLDLLAGEESKFLLVEI